jgi:hypothetical protein
MTQIPGISGVSADSHAAASLSMTSFGIPLIGSISAAGFTFGFMKG